MRYARNATITVALIFTLVLTASPAFSWWVSDASGVGRAVTGTLQAPTAVDPPARTSGSVPISWVAPSGSIVPTGYFVTRSSAGATAPACGSSRLSLITASSCVDAIAVDGIYRYTVTAVYRSWTTSSSPSSEVTVATPARLAFSVSPSTSVVNAVLSPRIAVTVQSTDGSPVATSGIQIDIAIGVNPAAGVLAGSLTALTSATGTATFPGLSIDSIGVGYTLVATSAGLTSATSPSFAITSSPLAGVNLGRAATYSVFGSAVTDNGLSTLSGDLGSIGALTGFTDKSVGGTTHAGDADVSAVSSDFQAAYADAVGRTQTTTFAGDQIGKTFLAGVHRTGAAFALSAGGVLTLDAQGDPNAVFIFQVDAALNTAADSSIQLANGAQAANVYWQVNGAAGTGADSAFVGTILANGAITIGARGTLIGRALASGAVTLASNTIRFT
ncbi:MAG: DUF3494 domain-containing protein [Kineosporiaceae bacterium]|nr:DUF3494 domain-containing protein [Aeromicrobium sp.]